MHRATLVWGTGAPVDEKRGLAARILADQVGGGTRALVVVETIVLMLIFFAGFRVTSKLIVLMRQHHCEDLGRLNNELRDYGVGLAVSYTALLRHWPRELPELLRLVRIIVGSPTNAKVKSAATSLGFPAKLSERQIIWQIVVCLVGSDADCIMS